MWWKYVKLCKEVFLEYSLQWPPIFGRSVNPIPTGGVQILTTLYYLHPQFFSPSSITGGWQLNLKDDGKNNRLEERRRENNTGPIWKMCALTFWVVLRGGFVQLSCFLRLRRLPWILLLSPRPWQNSWSSPRPDVRRRDVPAIKVTKYKVNPYTSS